MDSKKAHEWWFYRSPLIKQQLTVKYFPATNYNFLSISQIKTIYQHENKNLWNQVH
jgi:hypothetical protein